MYNLSDPMVAKSILNKFGFHFSKALGQNFLIDSSVTPNIAAGCGIDKNWGVIEIGPGIGTLTMELAKNAGKVISIELDKRLLPVLQYTLADFDNVRILNDDVLKVDLASLITEEFAGMNVAVCANLPYYITTPIIMYLLENRFKIKTITVMIQKEVAERLVADPGTSEYGAISLAVQYYSDPKILFKVSKECFMPSPKVDSAVIRMDVYDTPAVKVKSEKNMFSLIRASFNQRRKTLANAIFSGFHGKIEKSQIENALTQIGMPLDIRGERLGISDFAKISDIIFPD